MRFGLLQASFIPPKGQRDLRDLTRYRTKLVQERVREVNRVQGVLERANIKLASVIADILGVSGRAGDVSEVLVCYALRVYETQDNPQANRVIA